MYGLDSLGILTSMYFAYCREEEANGGKPVSLIKYALGKF